jgi:RecJ-like exonuclease
MSQYYRRVNEHNREAFKDVLPLPAAPGTATYVGQAECASCHGEADAFWQSTGHAGAYKTLSDQFKEFNLDCVGCHVTGYQRPGGSTVTHMQTLQNVQCEACHGPGSRHVESSGNTELITRAPDPKVCGSCHHTPHVADDWKAEQAWEHIIGPGHGQPAPPAPKP